METTAERSIRSRFIDSSRARIDAHIVCNDLVSLHKEERDSHNLVTVLAHHERLSLDAARQWAEAMHDDTLREFARLSAQLPSFSAEVDVQFARYVDGLRCCMCGNRDWFLSSARYQSTETSWPLAA